MKMKFYVTSGNHNVVVLAEDSHAAMLLGLKKIINDKKHPNLGILTMANEHGFGFDEENVKDDDMFARTEDLVKEIGCDDMYDFPSIEETINQIMEDYEDEEDYDEDEGDDDDEYYDEEQEIRDALASIQNPEEAVMSLRNLLDKLKNDQRKRLEEYDDEYEEF